MAPIKREAHAVVNYWEKEDQGEGRGGRAESDAGYPTPGVSVPASSCSR